MCLPTNLACKACDARYPGFAEGDSGGTVYDDGDIGAMPADVDMLFLFGVSTASGAGAEGIPAGVFCAVFSILLFEQHPSHGTGDFAVLVADKAADPAQGLNLYADVGSLVAVRQRPGVQAGPDVLGFVEAFSLGVVSFS